MDPWAILISPKITERHFFAPSAQNQAHLGTSLDHSVCYISIPLGRTPDCSPRRGQNLSTCQKLLPVRSGCQNR